MPSQNKVHYKRSLKGIHISSVDCYERFLLRNVRGVWALCQCQWDDGDEPLSCVPEGGGNEDSFQQNHMLSCCDFRRLVIWFDGNSHICLLTLTPSIQVCQERNHIVVWIHKKFGGKSGLLGLNNKHRVTQSTHSSARFDQLPQVPLFIIP